MVQLRRDYQRAIDSYIQVLSTQNKATNTIVAYRQDIVRFLKWYQVTYNAPLNRVVPNKINEYQSYLTAKSTYRAYRSWVCKLKIFCKHMLPSKYKSNQLTISLANRLSPNTRRRNIIGLHNFFQILLAISFFKGKMKYNPVLNSIHKVRVRDIDVRPTQVLGPREWKVLEKNTPLKRDQLLIHLLYFAGLRLSEAASLECNCLDSQQGILHLERKGGKRHRLKLWNAATLVKIWPDCKTGPVFPGRNKQAITSRALAKRIKQLLANAGLEKNLGPHSFRKGCATALYKKTRDLLYVRNYLNHTDAKVTQSYIDDIGISAPLSK